jgi:hypothetical protein
MSNNRIYIRDDSGELWFFEDGRIRHLGSEWIAEDQNGYPCNSWEEGIRLLNEMGYITPEIIP